MHEKITDLYCLTRLSYWITSYLPSENRYRYVLSQPGNFIIHCQAIASQLRKNSQYKENLIDIFIKKPVSFNIETGF